MTSTGRTLLVISAQPAPGLRAAIAAGDEPRRDYFGLQAALDADLLLRDDAQRTRGSRLIARIAGVRVALAWEAWRRRAQYDAIYSDSEAIGLPLALLLRWSGTRRGRPRHTMLTHYLTPAPKRLLFRLGARSHIDALIVHSTAQEVLAKDTLRMPARQVVKLPYFADEQFWRPPTPEQASADPADPPMICAVGLEFRDYTTLVESVRALSVEVKIAAGSEWSHHSAFAGSPELPANVTVQRYAYRPLRDLYAQARFVVVPLHDVDNQAGITVILEAMAMGKAVIVTATRGQTDVVRDPTHDGHGHVARTWWPGFVDDPTVAPTLAHLATGLYVAPGDAADLRQAITHLLDHPEVAAALGRNGRTVVEALFGLDAFAERFAAVIRGDSLPRLEAARSV